MPDKQMYVDMHVHSVFSDGTLTPEELAGQAADAGVILLALADHNTIKGSERMREACRKKGIYSVDAVEINTIYNKEEIHILSYCADSSCEKYTGIINYSRKVLDDMSRELIQRMESDRHPVSITEYEAYPDIKPEGGWKALYYLRDRGIIDELSQGFSLYGRYGVTYDKAPFPMAKDAIGAIHDAGGYAILAHPGDVSRLGEHVTSREIIRQMEELFETGLDGAECFYPMHTDEEAELFAGACRRRGKMITCGSDCHGTFSGKTVGYIKKTREELDIEKIVKRITV